jgi:hypothetical protein
MRKGRTKGGKFVRPQRCKIGGLTPLMSVIQGAISGYLTLILGNKGRKLVPTPG